MEPSRWVLKIEALLLLLALISAWMPAGKANRITTSLWWFSAIAGITYAGMRYWTTWPMTPMFTGSILFPPLLVILGTWSLKGANDQSASIARRWLAVSGLIVVLVGICFPKDFYVPIIKTTSLYAHGVLIFGSLGRACLFIAAGWGMAALCGHDGVMLGMFPWSVWGFGLWSLSLFSGEVGSYSGWGVPMVWEDASTLTAIGTWLFYVGVIHLHLGGVWSRRMRAAMGILGAVLILVLNGGPDMGPFRNPLSVPSTMRSA